VTAFETSGEATNLSCPSFACTKPFSRVPRRGRPERLDERATQRIDDPGRKSRRLHRLRRVQTTFYGTLPNPVAFVTGLYQHVLQRAPDNGGLTRWVHQITSGAMSFADVALGFSQSARIHLGFQRPRSTNG